LTDTKFPKISIITPSFNQGQFIEETILSIINQDYPNLEYIIYDGGSTDNTVEIIKKYSDKIAFWVSEKDAGQTNAINKGFRKATGSILNWINSDDQLLPGTLQTIARYFNENPEAIMVHGRIEYFGETQQYFSRNISRKNLLTRYVSHICMPQPACFFRKQLLDQQGLLDEKLHFSMDTDLYVRAGLHYNIVQVENVLARFRLHAASKSVSNFNKNFLSDNAIVFSRVLATLGYQEQINELKKLMLYTEPAYLYQPTEKQFDGQKMIFYFLEHRLFTLYFHGDKNAFKKIFAHLIKYHTSLLLQSGKLITYRLLLFLPAGFLHTLVKLSNKISN
jgi:glycosyltransferase involved in cell wall biosynthesis